MIAVADMLFFFYQKATLSFSIFNYFCDPTKKTKINIISFTFWNIQHSSTGVVKQILGSANPDPDPEGATLSNAEK
jgi:hypothetical protein